MVSARAVHAVLTNSSVAHVVHRSQRMSPVAEHPSRMNHPGGHSAVQLLHAASCCAVAGTSSNRGGAAAGTALQLTAHTLHTVSVAPPLHPPTL
jgi:hypothetical protein